MNYISRLTDEEIAFLCDKLSISYFRKSFKKTPQEYHRLTTVYRPETIPAEKVKVLILENRTTNFIIEILNNGIQALVDSVGSQVSTLFKSGCSEYRALLRVLPESDFAQRIDLYFKLNNDAYTAEYAELVQEALKELEDRTMGSSEKEEVAVALEQSSSPDVDTACEIESLQMEIKNTRTDLKEKERQIEELQKLMEYTDLTEAKGNSCRFPYISLCCVEDQEGNSVKLQRLADVSDGVIQKKWMDNSPNRNILYTKGRVRPTGKIGIWNWDTTPNFDPLKADYIKSEFQFGLIPTEVVLLDCEGVASLKSKLIQGVGCVPKSQKILFGFFEGEKVQGLLCQENSFSEHNGATVLKTSVLKLPLYEFDQSDVLQIDSMLIYSRVHLGTPKEIVPIVDPLTIVKDKILGYSPISKMKLQFSREMAQGIKKYLEGIPTADLYEEIAIACECSLDEAKDYVKKFIEQSHVYLNRADVSVEILDAAIQNNPALLEECQLHIEAQWRKEHASKIQGAKNELENIQKSILEKKDQYNNLITQENHIQDKLKKLESDISSRENLASEVEKKVSERIEYAKRNAANFIAETAFMQPASIQTKNITSYHFTPGMKLDPDKFEHHHTWEELLCTIKDEVEDAGVSDKFSRGFSAYLFAAYSSHIPLLLIGPNGRDIANAFSSAMFGKTASILSCEKDFSYDSIFAPHDGDDEILAIQNLFHTGWIDHISELFAQLNGFCVILQPFAEDLLIEPRGLYNYFLPVLTELLVDKAATGIHTGGCMTNDYEPYEPAQRSKPIPFTKGLPMSAIIRRNLSQLATDLRMLTGTDSSDLSILFGAFPYAYVTGNIETLWDTIESSTAVSKDVKCILRDFLGKDHE